VLCQASIRATTFVMPFEGDPDGDLSSVASFNDTFPNGQAAPVSQSDVAGLQSEFNSAAVPEPSLQLPLAALLAVLAGAAWRKSRPARV
jgi:hypothetical protein